MHFIDYLTLLLINMVAGYVLLAAYIYKGIEQADQRSWAPAFGITGLVATVFGGYLVLHGLLPAPYSMIFGEMSVLFGVLFLGAALAVACRWSLLPLTGYAFFAGLAAVVLGGSILHFHLTAQPVIAGVGFIFSGLAGMLAFPALAWFSGNRPLRLLGTLMLLGTAFIWAVTGYLSYWMHVVMTLKK